MVESTLEVPCSGAAAAALLAREPEGWCVGAAPARNFRVLRVRVHVRDCDRERGTALCMRVRWTHGNGHEKASFSGSDGSSTPYSFRSRLTTSARVGVPRRGFSLANLPLRLTMHLLTGA